MEVDGYLSMAEYTNKYKVSRQMIHRYLKKNCLRSKLIDGIRYVEDKNFRDISSNVSSTSVNDANEDQVVAGVQSKQEILLDARIRKLRADTDYQMQRLEEKKDEILSEYTDQIIEAYTESFAGVKNELITLRLDKEEIKEFTELFQKATKNFIHKLKSLRAKDEKSD